jgi:precorrin-3B C17-methyltransferase
MLALTLLPARAMLSSIMNGKVYLIGIGPGQAECITPEALSALAQTQLVIGHKDCLLLVSVHLKGKEIIEDCMSPLERSHLAVDKALSGHIVAILSIGHPGIYAIASTFYGYLRRNKIKLDVEVIPGLTLADYASARLGSPLGNDFAVISLADRASSWESIKQRIKATVAADFVLVIYNPLGKLDNRRIKTALKIISVYRAPGTPLALLTAVATKQEIIKQTFLSRINLQDITVDTLVIVGNSRTFIYEGKMITPRPYKAGVGY